MIILDKVIIGGTCAALVVGVLLMNQAVRAEHAATVRDAASYCAEPIHSETYCESILGKAE